ncbi:DUF262 domain-containing protein [Candidatus Methylospira mobilis]|uniref:DUF262 domain-containing protein n=1 Tax=Candidatus Methylospira mobilis TaxID=1808979 RepID=A0A5Q0BRA2_9GAMM|nr:DUF262 domain-containing protein [Candidatus Methylospira mobilis]QFY44607.1 DUF262 domain-containing protein [Candidatus Methylospira mobilis]
MSLIDQINNKRREIKTDGYPISIGEWISMYENNELDIHPEFQRFYRWSHSQKTSLIESILLGIPLPPIFVSQRNDGVWDVVDGLQRLSTIFQFVGILKDESGNKVEPLILEKTKYLPDLQDVQWENKSSPSHSLTKDMQLLVKRSKISASIVLRESDESAKYDLFQRLNTGGSQLSPQEVRNCLLVMLNKPLFEWLKDLSHNEAFTSTTTLSDRPIEESYDLELALRFLLLALIPESHIKSVGDVGAFLTDKMTEVAQNKQYDKNSIKNLFEQTFKVLDEVLCDDAFKRFNNNKNRHEGGFLVSLYEVIALGVAFNIDNNTLCDKSDILSRARSVWGDTNFTNWSGAGVTATRRLPKLIPYGRKLFNINTETKDQANNKKSATSKTKKNQIS